MYVEIADDGSLSLEDCDNFRAFSIRRRTPGIEQQALMQIATAAEDRHYWLDAEAVLALSGRTGDPVWVDTYWNMLAGVAAYGYYDEASKRVKAHVEVPDDPK